MIVKLKQYQLATTVHSGTDQVIKHAFCQSKTGRKYFKRQHMSDSPLTLFTLQIVQGSVTLQGPFTMVYLVRFFWLVYEQSGACYNLKSILLEHTTTTSTRNHAQGAVPYSTFQVAKLLDSFIVWTQTLLAILA